MEWFEHQGDSETMYTNHLNVVLQLEYHVKITRASNGFTEEHQSEAKCS